MHRLFVAIRPPQPVRDLLIDAMDDSPDFRWQDDEQLHLTLRFIGEVDRPIADDIAAALTRIHAEKFELRIAGVWRFEKGPAFYEANLRYTTTTNMTPEEVHQLGLHEAGEIASETVIHFVNRASDLAYAMARYADVDDPALFEGRGKT